LHATHDGERRFESTMGEAIFEGKHHRRPSQNGLLSEQDDIDSGFMPPNSEHSMISAESDDESIMEETFYSSDNSLKHEGITQVYDRTNSSDSDSDSEYYSDSEEEENSVEAQPHYDEQQDSDRELDPSNKPRKSKKTDKREKKEGHDSVTLKNKEGFFGKLFGSLKASPRGKKKPLAQKKRNPDLFDADIEQSESGYGTSGNGSYPHDASFHSDYDISVTEEMSESHSRSQGTHYVGDVSESEASSQASIMSPQPRRSLTKDRRNSYESVLPDVVEETENEQEPVGEYRTYRRPMAKDSDEHSYGSFEKKQPEEIEEPEGKPPPKSNSMKFVVPPARTSSGSPEITPDPATPKPEKQKAARVVQSPTKSLKSSRTKKKPKREKKKRKKKNKAHASALAGRKHTVSSRIDYAGQISMTSSPVAVEETLKINQNLEAEVHRLRTLVELMMTRMELYERQAECLVETSLEHDREWKTTTIEHFEEAAKKHTGLSETEERLMDIKNLLVERNIQDKWIRQLECIQRGYEERLTTTQNQLRTLRNDHILTNKQIVDYKKSDALTESTHTPDTFMEDITRSTKNSGEHIYSEATTPIMANGMGLKQRWVDPTVERKGSLSGRKGPDTTNDTTWASSQGLEPSGAKETPSLLEEMIVSWHTHNDNDNISLLSDRGTNKARKKAKKERRRKLKKKSINSSVDIRDPEGGFFLK